MSSWTQSEFARLLEGEAANLASFVLALVGDRHVADDVFQSACLELWRLRERFQTGTDFGAWSRSVARVLVLRHWRQVGREKVAFSSAAIERLDKAYDDNTGETLSLAARRQALRSCLETLTVDDRELLRRRYRDAVAVRRLAAETGRSEGGLKMALLRLRQKLAHCVRSRIRREARSHE